MSLTKWLTDMNVDNTTNPLPTQLQSLLLEDHGIANMMKESQCSRTSDAKYTTTNTTADGWNSGKDESVYRHNYKKRKLLYKEWESLNSH